MCLAIPGLPERSGRAVSLWSNHGITGVPGMIFDKQLLMTGAKGVETYGCNLDHLLSEFPA